MILFKILIYLFTLLICVNGLIKNYYFLNDQQNEQNTDEEWISSKEELSEYQKESNENNDFKFDDQSTFNKDIEEKEKDAANKLYQWNNLDMCNNINCRSNQKCIINKNNIAICVDNKQNNQIKKCLECSNMNNVNDIYCASNNRSYLSLCELVKFNCEKSTDFYPICQNECPCELNKLNLNKKLKLDYLWRYVNKRTDQAINLKKNKNSINQNNRQNKCTNKELNEIGQRLVAWFHEILKNQLKTDNLRSIKILNKIRSSFVRNCDEEVNFIFLNLDTNKDLVLSSDELYHLEHDQHEKCLKSYIDNVCDLNGDHLLNNNEWCNCFLKYRPCFRERDNLLINKRRLLNIYIPNCDKYGYYESLQCNKFTKLCWCVDKQGNELPNTKKQATSKINCNDRLQQKKLNLNQHSIDDDSEIDGDDDFEDDYQSETEGSGD